MHIKPGSIKNLLKDMLGDIPMTSSTYQVLASRLEVIAEKVSLRAGEILKEENEHRTEFQKIPPLKKLNDSHIKKAIRELIKNV